MDKIESKIGGPIANLMDAASQLEQLGKTSDCQHLEAVDSFQRSYEEWKKREAKEIRKNPLDINPLEFYFAKFSSFYETKCRNPKLAQWFHNEMVDINPFIIVFEKFSQLMKKEITLSSFLATFQNFIDKEKEYDPLSLISFFDHTQEDLLKPENKAIAKEIYLKLEKWNGPDFSRFNVLMKLAHIYFETWNDLEPTQRVLQIASNLKIDDDFERKSLKILNKVFAGISSRPPSTTITLVDDQIPKEWRPTRFFYQFKKEGRTFVFSFYGNRFLFENALFFDYLEGLPLALLKTLFERNPPAFFSIGFEMEKDQKLKLKKFLTASSTTPDPTKTWIQLDERHAYGLGSKGDIDLEKFPAQILYHEIIHWIIYHHLTKEDQDLMARYFMSKLRPVFSSRKERSAYLQQIKKDGKIDPITEAKLSKVFATHYGRSNADEDFADLGSLVLGKEIFHYTNNRLSANPKLYHFFQRIYQEAAWGADDFRRVFREEFGSLKGTRQDHDFHKGPTLISTFTTGISSKKTVPLEYALTLSGFNGRIDSLPRLGINILLDQPLHDESPIPFLGGFADYLWGTVNLRSGINQFQCDISANYFFGKTYAHPETGGLYFKVFGGVGIAHSLEGKNWFAGAALGFRIPHLVQSVATDYSDWEEKHLYKYFEKVP